MAYLLTMGYTRGGSDIILSTIAAVSILWYIERCSSLAA